MRRLLVPVLLLSLCYGRLGAWGVEGHHIVARIALSQMTPEARRAVQDLLGNDDFVASSTWADEVRPERPETYNWHFVDIPYGEQKYDPARDCQPSSRGDCILAELARARGVLSDTTLPHDQRKEALKFLIHFVGDLHQPLHAIDNHDRGGNDVHVTVAGHGATGRGPLNLHTVWDSTLIGQRGIDEAAYADLLIEEIKTHPISALPLDVVAWAEGTHQIAVEYAYGYPGFSSSGPPANVVELSAEYQQQAWLAIDHQLELAGVRLAALLNRTFALLRNDRL